ncbi:MAG: potassium channel family protein [Microbacteriaceae bacterium]
MTAATPRLEKWEKATEWPLAGVAAVLLVAFSIQVLAQPQGWVATAYNLLAWTTWLAFTVDYVVRMYLTTDRTRWFFQHLLDLAIVLLPLIRPLRLLRVVVLITAIQKVIGGAFRGRVVVYTGVSVLLLVYVASLAVLDVERYAPDSKIVTFGDAVWWAVTTITTVGYGDLAPVTGVGRVIAVVLMIGGISLLGVVTATLASWIVQRVAEEDAANQAATAAHIEALRRHIDEQNEMLRNDIRCLQHDRVEATASSTRS